MFFKSLMVVFLLYNISGYTEQKNWIGRIFLNLQIYYEINMAHFPQTNYKIMRPCLYLVKAVPQISPLRRDKAEIIVWM